MKKNTAFFVSLLLMLTMAMGAVNPALADAQPQKGDYFVASQTDGTKTSQTIDEANAAITRENGGVSISKTIAETDTENVFDVTLKVETEQQVSTISTEPEAAVVLVFDASRSMIDPFGNGTRMDAARAAAQAFLKEYASVSSGVRRMVSVVAFWKDAYIIQDWVDIKNASKDRQGNYTILNSKHLTTELNNHSGTNIEAGLLLAENLIKEESSGGSAVLNGITNRHVVLLSDGASNASVVGAEDVKNYVRFYGSTSEPILYYKDANGNDAMAGATNAEKKNYDGSTIKFSLQSRQITSLLGLNDVLYGMYNNADYHFHHKDPVHIAQRIRSYIGPNKDVKVQMHSIYCGSDSEPLSNTGDTSLSGNTARARAIREKMATYGCKYCDAALYDIQHKTKSENNDVRKYLADISDSYATTSGMNALSTAFSAIQETIRKDISAWQTMDMLGSGYDFVEFRGSYASGEVSLLPEGNGLNWDLKKAANKGSAGRYRYEMTYRVKLDTFDPAFNENTLYPSNQWANLRYFVVENNVASPTQTVYYNHPSAKGFKDDLTFTKVNQYNQVLSGAKFKLVSVEKDALGNPLWTSGEVTSDANGQVAFTGIPSGHNYTLVETAVPAGHTATDKDYEVRVSYGTATLYDEDNNVATQVVNTSNTVYTTLTLSKTVVGGDSNKPFDFVVKLTAPNGSAITHALNVLDASGNTIGMVQYNNSKKGYAISLKHGQFVKLGGIELGSRYEITETDYTAEGYTTAGTLKREGTITSRSGETVEYINTLYRKLSIQKILAGSAANANHSFSFHFRLLDANGRAITGAVLSAKDGAGNTVAVSALTGEKEGWYSAGITGAGTILIEGIPGSCTRVLMHEQELGFGYEASYADKNGNALSPDVLVTDSYAVSYGGALETGYRVTNTRDHGSLLISKEIETIVQSDLDKSFDFEIAVTKPREFADAPRTLSGYKNGSITETPITFVNGKAIVALRDGEYMRIEGFVVGTEYTVTETARDGFETTITKTVGTNNPTTENGTKIDGRILAGQPTALHYLNKSTAGGLIVKKQLISEYPADAGKKFGFVVTIANNSLNLSGRHTFGDVTFENGVAVFELGNGESKAITGLPAGTSYSVVEGRYETARSVIHPYTDEFEVVYTGDQNGTIQAQTQKTVLVTNTRRTGNLIVRKSVVSSDTDDVNKEFTFTVELSDKGANHSHGDVQFVNGVATFTLKHNEQKTISHLPVGMGYTITEHLTGEDAKHFTTVITGATGDHAHDGTRQITGVLAAGDNRILYSNEHIEAALAITKSVSSPSDIDNNREFTFHLTIVNQDGSTDTSINGNFNTTHVGVPGANGESQKTNGTIAFADGVASGVVTLKRGESFYINNLPVGKYVHIKEDAYIGVNNLTYYPAQEKTVQVGSQADAMVMAAFENVRTTGSLKVSKTVNSVYDADLTRLYQFTVTLKRADGSVASGITGSFGDMYFDDGVATFTLLNGNSKTATGLPQGIGYAVTEEAVTGIATTMTGDTGIITGTQAHAQFTNTRNVQAGLRIRKVVESGNALDKMKPFTVTVEIPELNKPDLFYDDDADTRGEITFKDGKATLLVQDGTTFTARLLPENAHFNVTETAADGFTTTVASGVEGSLGAAASGLSATGNLVNGQIMEVVFTNKRTSAADLRIVKNVVSPYETDEKDTPYTFTVDLQQDIDGVFAMTGDSESSSIRFKDGVAELVIKGKGACVIHALPTGVRYKVTEKALPGFATNPLVETGEIPLSGEATATFTNTRLTSDLVVRKTVDSVLPDDQNKEFEFTVTLSDSRLSGTFRSYTNGSTTPDANGVTFTNGVATFKLKHGESKRIAYLPVDIDYVVTEAADARFVVEKSGDIGTITANTTHTASFLNRNTHGGFVVMKKVESTYVNDLNREYHMLVRLGDESISGVYGDVTFNKGEAVFTLKNEAYKIISGLPAGTEYSVMEGTYVNGSFQGNSSEFNVEFLESENIQEKDLTHLSAWTAGNGAGVAAANSWQGVLVKNTRRYGGFTLKKLVASDRQADAGKEFRFEIRILNPKDNSMVIEAIDGVYGDVTFADGEAAVNLKHNESVTVTGLPVGVHYSIQEVSTQSVNLNDFLVTIVGAQNDQIDTTAKTITGPVLARNQQAAQADQQAGLSQIVFSNEHEAGDLAIAKIVQSPSEYDNDRDFTFHLEILGVNNEVDTSANKPEGYAYKKVAQDASEHNGRLTVTSGVSASFTLRAGETIYFTDIPTGKVRVVEAPVVQNGITIFDGDQQIADVVKGDGSQVTARFTNVRKTGSLTVSKSVVSPYQSDKAKRFRFRVTLLRTVNGQDVVADGITDNFGMSFVNGVAEFDLEHGMTKTATGLPAGAKYKVEEIDVDGNIYSVTKTGDTGVIRIDAGQQAAPAHAAFTNTRNVQAGLRVVKTVVSDNPQDKQKVFRVRVTMHDADGTPIQDGTYGQMTFANGMATLEVTDGSSFAAWGLPVGSKFTVAEEEADGFVAAAATTVENYNNTVENTKLRSAGVTLPVNTIESGTVHVVTITNTRETGSLKVSKTVESPMTSDKQKEFSFVVQLDPAIAAGTYGEMTFDADGRAAFMLKDGESMTASGLPTGVRYTVTEAADAGFDTAYTNRTGEITMQDANASVVNTRKTGDLVVRKTVDSVLTGDQDVEFEFTVTLGDRGISGTFRSYTNGSAAPDANGVTFTDGVATFNLKHGESKRIEHLPVDVGYVVTENADVRFAVEKSGDVGTITADATQTASFLNKNTHGGFVVMKKVESTYANDLNREYHMLVRLGDESISGVYGDVTFTDGQAVFTLKNEEYKVISGLPAGTEYSVMEGEYVDSSFQNYSSEFNVEFLESENIQEKDLTQLSAWTAGDGAGVAAANSWQGVVVKNARRYGGFTLKKLVASDRQNDAVREFRFEIRILNPKNSSMVIEAIDGVYGGVTFAKGLAAVNLKHNESVTVTGLPVGVHYSIQEVSTTDVNLNDFLVTIIGAQNDQIDTTAKTITGPVLARASQNDPLSQIVFTNEHKAGDLAIAKIVQSPSEYDNDRDFTFRLEILGVNNEVDTSANKPEGYAYKKVAQDASEHNGSLTVTSGVSASFTLRAGETIYFTDIPTGKVRVVEAPVEQNGITIFDGGEQIANVVKGDGNQVTAEFTNVRETGSLTVSKSVVSPYHSDKAKRFSFRVKLWRSETEVATGITDNFGGMSFVNGVAEFDLEHGMTKVATGLPAGARYTVEEINMASGVYDVTKTGDTGFIQRETNTKASERVTPAHAAFTNTRNVQAGLRVVKNVVSDNPQDKQKVFRVRVTMHNDTDEAISGTYGQMTFANGEAMLEVTDGSSFAAWGLPVGSKFTVAEEAADGFIATAVTTEEDYNNTTENTKLSSAGVTLPVDTIASGVVHVVTITNTRETGSLTVRKTVESPMVSDRQKDFSFVVQLDQPIAAKAYGGMTFDANGRAAFTLKHGESMTANGLPTGVSYTVTEVTDAGFDTAYTNRTGEITAQGATVSVVNTRKTGELLVTKNVISRIPEDMTKAFNVTLTLTDANKGPVSGTFGGHVFDSNGQTKFDIVHGQNVRFTGLPIDANYRVDEAVYSRFDTTYTAQEGQIGKDVQVQIVNTRKTAGADDVLEIKKTLISPLKSDLSKAFTFDVTLSDPTVVGEYDVEYGSGTKGKLLFTQGKAVVQLCGGESVSILGLPLGVTCEVNERAEAGFTVTLNGAAQRTLDEGGVTYEFTNTRETKGSLTVSKTVIGDAASEEDVFTFAVRIHDLADGEYGGAVFTSGEATLQLRHGESVVITGIPVGTAWEVVETDYGNYTPVNPVLSGVTTEAGDNAAFVNELSHPQDIPQTGDRSNLALYVALLGVCLVAILRMRSVKMY